MILAEEALETSEHGSKIVVRQNSFVLRSLPRFFVGSSVKSRNNQGIIDSLVRILVICKAICFGAGETQAISSTPQDLDAHSLWTPDDEIGHDIGFADYLVLLRD